MFMDIASQEEQRNIEEHLINIPIEVFESSKILKDRSCNDQKV